MFLHSNVIILLHIEIVISHFKLTHNYTHNLNHSHWWWSAAPTDRIRPSPRSPTARPQTTWCADRWPPCAWSAPDTRHCRTPVAANSGRPESAPRPAESYSRAADRGAAQSAACDGATYCGNDVLAAASAGTSICSVRSAPLGCRLSTARTVNRRRVSCRSIDVHAAFVIDDGHCQSRQLSRICVCMCASLGVGEIFINRVFLDRNANESNRYFGLAYPWFDDMHPNAQHYRIRNNNGKVKSLSIAWPSSHVCVYDASTYLFRSIGNLSVINNEQW